MYQTTVIFTPVSFCELVQIIRIVTCDTAPVTRIIWCTKKFLITCRYFQYVHMMKLSFQVIFFFLPLFSSCGFLSNLLCWTKNFCHYYLKILLVLSREVKKKLIYRYTDINVLRKSKCTVIRWKCCSCRYIFISCLRPKFIHCCGQVTREIL